MISAMQGQRIVEKTSLPKRRKILGRGLTVIALCLIVLCVALAIGIAVIVSKSSSRDAPDSDAETLPLEPEALVWKYFWRKLPKKKTTTTTTVVTSNDAERPDAVAPVPKRTETNKPEQKTATTVATGSDEIVTTLKPKNTRYLCQTDECKSIVSNLLDYMDRNADPCSNFYQYACGGFPNHTDVPEDKLSVSTFTHAEDKLQEQLGNIFNANDGHDEPKSFKLAKTLYKSCMNTSTINTEAMKLRLSNLLMSKRVTHQSSTQHTSSWRTLLHSFYDLGYSVNYLFEFDVDADIENSTAHAIYLDEAVQVHRLFYLKDKNHTIYAYYRQYISDVANILNATEYVNDELLDMAENFQIELAKISLAKELRPEETGYNRTTLGQFIKQYPGLSWMQDYFKMVLSETIDGDEIVIVKSNNYFANLEKLSNATENDALASYIVWRALIDSAIYMHDEINEETWTFKQSLIGLLVQQPRTQECVGVVCNKFPHIVSAMYAKRYYDDNARNEINEFLDDYTKALAKTLKRPGSLNNPIKQAALEKQATTRVIFHPTKKEMDMPEDLYEELVLSEDNYFENSLNLTRFARYYTFKKLRQSTLESDWAPSTTSIFKQARYSHAKNSLDVSALVMQPPYFSNDQPAFLNYAGIGFLMSRQFASAFDYNGRHYDQRGNIIKGVNPTSDAEYEDFLVCTQNNYMEQIHQNEDRPRFATTSARPVKKELFADMAGLTIAYSIYEEWIAKNNDAPNLSADGLTPKQLFWISAAQTRCTKYKPRPRHFYMTTEFYFPEWLMVAGMMSNTRELPGDFSCPRLSLMSRAVKCDLW